MTVAVLAEEPPFHRTPEGRPITGKYVSEVAKRLGIRRARRPRLSRPRTRADCLEGPRPCPWVGCRYHLALSPWAKQDASDDDLGSHGLKLSRPETAAGELGGIGYTDKAGQFVAATCALDLADKGPISLADVAEIEGVSREWERKVYRSAEAKVRERAPDVWHLLELLYEGSKGRSY